MGVDKRLLKGLSKEQQAAVKYFVADGCLGRVGCLSDEEYDRLVASKVAQISPKKRALSKIGLDEDQVNEIAPINFEGYCYYDKAYARRGKDKKWRSSKYQITWLFFSDEQVYVYILEFNTTNDKKSERTEEYFYRDVTNFSTAIESDEIKNNKKGRPETVEWAAFSVVVPGDKITCSTNNTRGDVERSISAMKQKLREKKAAIK